MEYNVKFLCYPSCKHCNGTGKTFDITGEYPDDPCKDCNGSGYNTEFSLEEVFDR